jgi:protein-L-isoaspartate(D-aspartate) O-methyltransferase
MYPKRDIQAQQEARDRMVESQIVARGVRDQAVLAAMRRVPRHLFLSAERQADAYLDHPAPIDCSQTISQPYMVAVMTEMLMLKPGAHVLEIGTGSGYQTAVLAEIARRVVSVERHALLADTARQRLEALGYDNITMIVGDGTLGYPEEAPYDAILVTAGAPDIPEVLQQQLATGGRLVAPVGRTDVQQLITITREDDNTFTRQPALSCRFVPLIGEHGWRE